MDGNFFKKRKGFLFCETNYAVGKKYHKGMGRNGSTDSGSRGLRENPRCSEHPSKVISYSDAGACPGSRAPASNWGKHLARGELLLLNSHQPPVSTKSMLSLEQRVNRGDLIIPNE